jgi:hypothetical protein
MFIIGCDFHSRFQQIVMLYPTTGEVIERPLEHENGEAKKFYATLPSPARVGMEATFDAQWFERIITNSGSEKRRRSVQPWCGSKRRTRAMPCIFSTCAHEPFSPDLGAVAGGARPAADAAASAQAGSLSYLGDEPTAAPSVEKLRVKCEFAVHGEASS